MAILRRLFGAGRSTPDMAEPDTVYDGCDRTVELLEADLRAAEARAAELEHQVAGLLADRGRLMRAVGHDASGGGVDDLLRRIEELETELARSAGARPALLKAEEGLARAQEVIDELTAKVHRLTMANIRLETGQALAAVSRRTDGAIERPEPAPLWSAMDEVRREMGLPWWQVALQLDAGEDAIRRLRAGSASDDLCRRAEEWLAAEGGRIPPKPTT